MKSISLSLTPALPLFEEVRANDSASVASVKLPVISRPLLCWFTWYSRRYLRRHFHSLRISLAGLPPTAEGLPLVVYSNHAAWWDALVCLVLKAEFYPERRAFAPIDAAMLQRYKMFRRMGFFGVEQHSRQGALQFIRTGEAILQSPSSLLAITPQARFTDVRERPVQFAAGLGQLAARVSHTRFVPCAIEYAFWDERLPEILVRFGEPVTVRAEHNTAFDAKYWTRLFEQKMTETQDALAVEVRSRDAKKFETRLHGGAGQGGVYDLWRAVRAGLRGESFNREHGPS